MPCRLQHDHSRTLAWQVCVQCSPTQGVVPQKLLLLQLLAGNADLLKLTGRPLHRCSTSEHLSAEQTPLHAGLPTSALLKKSLHMTTLKSLGSTRERFLVVLDLRGVICLEMSCHRQFHCQHTCIVSWARCSTASNSVAISPCATAAPLCTRCHAARADSMHWLLAGSPLTAGAPSAHRRASCALQCPVLHLRARLLIVGTSSSPTCAAGAASLQDVCARQYAATAAADYPATMSHLHGRTHAERGVLLLCCKAADVLLGERRTSEGAHSHCAKLTRGCATVIRKPK